MPFRSTARTCRSSRRRNAPKGTPDEDKAIVQGSLAHYGTYAVNDADKTFTLHVVASSFPNWDGTKQTRKITALTDDVLTYSVPNPTTGAAPGESTTWSSCGGGRNSRAPGGGLRCPGGRASRWTTCDP